MVVEVFLIGGTGLIGGALLTLLLDNKQYHVTALLRDQIKVEKLQSKGISTVIGDLDNIALLTSESLKADVVIHTANADHLPSAKAIADALVKKAKESGKHGIYIHTSGSGIVGDAARGLTSYPQIYDDGNTAEINAIPLTNLHRDVDTYLIEQAKNNFNLVIVAPSLIYGQSSGNDGISNPISVQIPLAIKTAIKHKKVYGVGKGANIWSNVHISDVASLFYILLEKLVKNELKPEDQGYYFAENGQHEWHQVYDHIAKVLLAKKYITDGTVHSVTSDEEITNAYGFADAMYYVGSNSRVKASKGRKLGWTPKHNDVFGSIEQDIDYLLAKESK